MITKKIAIIGGGVMGRGVAQLAIQNGFEVTLTNRSSQKSLKSEEMIRENLHKALQKGKINQAEFEQALENLSCVISIEEAVSQTDLVIENVDENFELKAGVFQQIEEHLCEHAILATNTSSLSINKLSEHVSDAGRFIGMHFFNPPYAMKLLEIVVGQKTLIQTYQEAHEVGTALKRTAIRVNDSPGFATSRLSVCIGLEAIRMLEEGVALADDIDTAMEVGYRHPMGPLKLGDWVGLDVRLQVAEYLNKELKSKTFDIPSLLKEMVKKGQLGRKSGQGFHSWPSK